MTELEFLNEWDDWLSNPLPKSMAHTIETNRAIHFAKYRQFLARWQALGGNPRATKLLALELNLPLYTTRRRLRTARRHLGVLTK